MLADNPVIAAAAVSVALMARLPAVLSVAKNVPAPLVSVALAGKVAALSLLVKRTVPAYPVAVLLNWSSAVTVKLIAVPAVAVAGAVTLK